MTKAPFRCDFTSEGDGNDTNITTAYFLVDVPEDKEGQVRLAQLLDGESFSAHLQVVEDKFGAFDFMGEESDLVSLSTYQVAPELFSQCMKKWRQLFAKAEFTVGDVQIGSPEDYQAQVFEPQTAEDRVLIAALVNNTVGEDEPAPARPARKRP